MLKYKGYAKKEKVYSGVCKFYKVFMEAGN